MESKEINQKTKEKSLSPRPAKFRDEGSGKTRTLSLEGGEKEGGYSETSGGRKKKE